MAYQTVEGLVRDAGREEREKKRKKTIHDDERGDSIKDGASLYSFY